ncbi:unnamed protein product [Closterium sp. Yama58-4]|nr:unnamed protein product [Closterium sp. Yama58-4]
MCNTVWFFSESQCAGVATGIELPDGPQHASPRNYSYGFTVKRNVRGPLASVASVGCSYSKTPQMDQALVVITILFISAGKATVAASFDPATQITLYNQPRFFNSPVTLSEFIVRPDPQVACYNLPSAFSKTIGSAKIAWSTRTASATRVSCSTVWFFPGLKCAGTPKGVPRPATVSNASSSLSFISVLAEPVRSAASFACSYDRNPCAVISCPANTTCTSYGNTAHACPCSPGFTRVNGNCVDKCTARNCPANSSCYLRGGAAECVCKRGFVQQSNGSCAPQPDHDEWLGSQNEARASVGSPLLVWNDTLAAAARAWGTKLTSTSCYNTSLEKGVPYGQNTLAAYGFAPRDTVNVWMSGRLSYTRAEFPNGCKNGQLRNCIHFLRAVWNTTKSVGCAAVPCTEEWSTYICNYYPMGGIAGTCPY